MQLGPLPRVEHGVGSLFAVATLPCPDVHFQPDGEDPHGQTYSRITFNCLAKPTSSGQHFHSFVTALVWPPLPTSFQPFAGTTVEHVIAPGLGNFTHGRSSPDVPLVQALIMLVVFDFTVQSAV